ncbi:MAG TPA: hypothetical protein VN372_03165 [Methanospirillum sp.]|nr:hypothetical protein [Methanospirillum sp.]
MYTNPILKRLSLKWLNGGDYSLEHSTCSFRFFAISFISEEELAISSVAALDSSTTAARPVIFFSSPAIL